jgi:uncharacterized protein (TIGR02270 family)
MHTLEAVVSQHASEIVFLWELREVAVCQPHYSMSDLAKLDERINAHIDGVRVAGEAGWEICKDSISSGEAGEVFASAVLAFESNQESRIESVLSAGTTTKERSAGLVSALGWLPFPEVEKHIAKLLTSTSSNLMILGIGASVVHRVNPGLPLLNALSHHDRIVRECAFDAVGKLGLTDLLSEVKNHIDTQDIPGSFPAAWSAALLGDSRSLGILQSVTESDLPFRWKALQLAVRRMSLQDAKACQRKLAAESKRIRMGIIAAGAIGDPVNVPWLIELMKATEVSRLAGEAFTMITGVDIDYHDLERDAPQGFESGPTDNPEDEDVELDPDENLAWPDPELIAKWWSAHQGEFKDGIRYLLGKPITVEWMQEVLRLGRQRQRAAAALEMAILKPGQPLFNIKAPGFRQEQLLRLR